MCSCHISVFCAMKFYTTAPGEWKQVPSRQQRDAASLRLLSKRVPVVQRSIIKFHSVVKNCYISAASAHPGMSEALETL